MERKAIVHDRALVALASTAARIIAEGAVPPGIVLANAFKMASEQTMDLDLLGVSRGGVDDRFRRDVVSLLEKAKMPGFVWKDAMLAALGPHWKAKRRLETPVPADARRRGDSRPAAPVRVKAKGKVVAKPSGEVKKPTIIIKKQRSAGG